MMRKLLVALLLVAPMCPLLLPTTAANAAVGSWYYDNKDPSATGCNNDAYTVDTRYLPSSPARVLLRYSPSCRTVWAHVLGAATRVAGQNAGGTARIHRNADDAGISCYSPVGGTGCYTMMLYDANMTSHAHGWNDTGFTIYSATTINW